MIRGREAGIPSCGPDGLTDAAAFHKVSGFLVAAAEEDRRLASWIGRDEFDLLVEQRGRAALWTRALELEIGRVEQAIATANGAPAILLKGAGLARAFYADPGLRASTDIDVMVEPSRVEAVGEALAGVGYRPAEGDSPWFMKSKHHAEFERPAGSRRYLVEVHARCVDDPVARSLDFGSLLPRALPLDLSDGSLTVPSPSDQILLSSMHVVSDIARNLTSINDVRLAARTVDEATWAETFERARDLGLLWPLNRALDLAAHFFGEARRRPLPPAGRPAFGPMVAADVYAPRAAMHVAQFATASWRLRAAYLSNLLWPPREQLAWLDEEPGLSRPALRARYFATALGSLFRDRS